MVLTPGQSWSPAMVEEKTEPKLEPPMIAEPPAPEYTIIVQQEKEEHHDQPKKLDVSSIELGKISSVTVIHVLV